MTEKEAIIKLANLVEYAMQSISTALHYEEHYQAADSIKWIIREMQEVVEKLKNS